MSEEYKTNWKVEIEACGTTKAQAVAWAMRVVALMVSEAGLTRYTSGGTNGGAAGKFIPLESDERHDQ